MFTGHFTDIPQAIQLALAPVFLLTGIAGLLNIMTGRLARIIDRGRKLVEQPLPEQLMGPEQLQRELQILEYRTPWPATPSPPALCRLYWCVWW